MQIDIEGGLKGFPDASFDHVILSQALQALASTEIVLAEMLRVGKEVLLSFPNFAFKTNREAINQGNMPVSEDLPYEWYDTPNIRFLTISDFENLCQKMDIKIHEGLAFDEAGKKVLDDPNLNGSLAFYRLGKKWKI